MKASFEIWVVSALGVALFWTLSVSVAVPFLLLSMAYGGMAYADGGLLLRRRLAEAEAGVSWRRAMRCGALGVMFSAASISCALMLVGGA